MCRSERYSKTTFKISHMKRRYVIIASLLLIIAGVTFHSCKEELEDLTGYIVGTVSDKTTGEPVSTVKVTLEPGGKSAVTGSDGNYLFSELEAQGYTVSVEKQGYSSDSKVVDVSPGKQTKADFLIDRMPSVVTVDRTVLDFGEGSDVNSLSFNIINSSYEDLEWTIEYDCEWIKEIRDDHGVLAYGKTQTIVVFIDRRLLVTGENKTVIVVKSSNGSSDLEVTAIGEERVDIVLNTLDVEDITSSSATFYGEIINEGQPRYSERGFVFSTKSEPTKATSIEVITAPVTEDMVFSGRVTDMELNQKYYVRAYGENENGIFYASNEVTFVTDGIDPVVSVMEATDIDVQELSAVLNGSVEKEGDPAYTEKGFVYGETPNPTIADSSVVAPGGGTGTYSVKIDNLKFDQKYYVKAYVKNDLGINYSISEISFLTKGADPSVSVLDVSDLSVTDSSAVLNGRVEQEGVPKYVEKGFVLGMQSNPKVTDSVIVADGLEDGNFSAVAGHLKPGRAYYVKAYARTFDGRVVYSPTEKVFTLSVELPQISVAEVSDISSSTMTAVLNGMVMEAGDPPYDYKGFVYSHMPNPTVEDSVITVYGKGTGAFSSRISNVQASTGYYVRAYATAGENTVYSSNEVSFSIETVTPEVSVQSVSGIDVSSRKAVLNGTIVNAGDPHYSERGFVYGTKNNPTIYDMKVVAPGEGTGLYSAEVADLLLDSKYFVRSYVISGGNVYYSKEEVDFTLTTAVPDVSIRGITNLDYSGQSAVFKGEVISSGNPAYTERGFVYGTVNSPTVYDNVVRAEGFGTGAYNVDVTGLQQDVQYYVRAYATNDGGTAYSKSELSFTLSPTMPEVSVQSVSNVNIQDKSVIFNGTVSEIGNPAYSEKGFVYGTEESPTIYGSKVTVEGSGKGTYSASVSGLMLDRMYYVRAYAVSEAGVIYSDGSQSFTISIVPPEITMNPVTGINYGNASAIFRAELATVGNPPYTERGFVYGTQNQYPELCDDRVSVPGSGTGSYFTEVSNLTVGCDYYVWAYTVNDGQTLYSGNSEKFRIEISRPDVRTFDAVNVVYDSLSGMAAAVLKGMIADSDPLYTEKGFVYNSVGSPTLNDSKITVDGSQVGEYSYYAENLPVDGACYIRAYAINDGGVSYGNTVSLSSKIKYTSDFALMVQAEDIGSSDYDSIEGLCKNSRLGGYSDWRLPTLEELLTLYTEKDRIRGFEDSYYWSSTGSYEIKSVNFADGTVNNSRTFLVHYGRCVRTMTTSSSE